MLKVHYACRLAGRRAAGAVHEDLSWVSAGRTRDEKKIFAYFLNDHHGDGIVGVVCKVLPGDNAALIKADPKRFYMPAYVGPRGWVGLRLDVGRVNWGEVEELVKGSYELVAGKKSTAIVYRS